MVCGGTALSNRMEGPVAADPEPEKSDERMGNIKINKRGSKPISVVRRDAGGSGGAFGSRGLRRGLAPPNWCTLIPGPPPKLKTNSAGAALNIPPPRSLS